MFVLLLNDNTLNCFSELIALYLEDVPELIEIKKYIEHKSEETEIVISYNAKLITRDEFSYFLMAHIYTEFVMMKKNIRNVSVDEMKDIHQKIRLMIFG